jgi:hypothetical protein
VIALFSWTLAEFIVHDLFKDAYFNEKVWSVGNVFWAMGKGENTTIKVLRHDHYSWSMENDEEICKNLKHVIKQHIDNLTWQPQFLKIKCCSPYLKRIICGMKIETANYVLYGEKNMLRVIPKK